MTVDKKEQPKLSDDLKREEELHRRRFVHATRPREPMTMNAAAKLHARMQGIDPTTFPVDEAET